MARDLGSADQAALYRFDGPSVVCAGLDPPHLGSPLTTTQTVDQFPFGIPCLQPSRFVLIEDARPLPVGGIDLAALGVRSVVHLPLGEAPSSLGALQLFHRRRVVTWDDDVGALLRALGGFVLARLLAPEVPAHPSADSGVALPGLDPGEVGEV